ncbi:MAG TPA: YbaB/EbfC family nucleoid-associated protein [Firmicutes bacterium]|nr:YbaB/EbfC family nucleoid-associated protein [Bacillota bacterium]
MMGNMGNMGKMMKQIQKMQQDLEKVHEELKWKTVEATAGGGVVKVVANGHQEIVEVSISPEVVDPDDVEMLEDLILAATNEALSKASEMASSEVEKVAGGLSLPGVPGIGKMRF